jgi:uncharacterized protein YjiS (DUF1127 family)
MSAYDFAASSGKVARQAAPKRVIRVAADLYRAWQNRRAFYRLGELSDLELADIGLTRSDLHVAVDAPFGSDPTVRLRSITEDRFDMIENLARRVG